MGASQSGVAEIQRFIQFYKEGADLSQNQAYRRTYLAIRRDLEANAKSQSFPPNFTFEGFNLFSICVIFGRPELCPYLVKCYDDPAQILWKTYSQELNPPITNSEEENEPAKADNEDNESDENPLRELLGDLLLELSSLPKPSSVSTVPLLEASIVLGKSDLSYKFVKKWSDSFRVKYKLEEVVDFICASEVENCDFSLTLYELLPDHNIKNYVEALVLLADKEIMTDYLTFFFEKVKETGDMKEFLCAAMQGFPEGQKYEQSLRKLLIEFINTYKDDLKEEPEFDEFCESLGLTALTSASDNKSQNSSSYEVNCVVS